MSDDKSIVAGFKKIGSRFAFFFFLEVFHDKLVKQFREVLEGITPQDIKDMVQKHQYPYIPPEGFRSMEGYEKYIVRIKVGYIAEMIGEARPDLAQALLDMGMEGGLYIHELRAHLIELVLHPEKAMAASPEFVEYKPQDMVLAKCQECEKTWPVPRADFDKIEACPFCGKKAKGEAPPQPIETPVEEAAATGKDPD